MGEREADSVGERGEGEREVGEWKTTRSSASSAAEKGYPVSVSVCADGYGDMRRKGR